MYNHLVFDSKRIRFAIWKIFHNFMQANDLNK